VADAGMPPWRTDSTMRSRRMDFRGALGCRAQDSSQMHPTDGEE
jgi:hypothetical protein